MKPAWISLFCIVLLSKCSKPNPLCGREGVWMSVEYDVREINSEAYFYLIINKEQTDNGNIMLTGNKLTIKHAELCSPFLKGKNEFKIQKWNDTLIYLEPTHPLPGIHNVQPNSKEKRIVLKKCKARSTIQPKTVGILSVSFDSISPANYMIEIQNRNVIYMQRMTHNDHSDEIIYPISPYHKRVLSKEERKMLDELMKYSHFDTISIPREITGCIFTHYYTKPAFNLDNKDYTWKYYGRDDRNSNMAIEGFLLSIARRGQWELIDGKHHFCSQPKIRTKPKKLVFIPQ